MSNNFNTNLVAALISVGVSLLFSIIYFFGRKIYSCYTRHKEFKMYKKYLIEFLENYLYYLVNNRFKYYNKEYEIDNLMMTIYHQSVDTLIKIYDMVAPTIVFSFLKENKNLSNK